MVVKRVSRFSKVLGVKQELSTMQVLMIMLKQMFPYLKEFKIQEPSPEIVTVQDKKKKKDNNTQNMYILDTFVTCFLSVSILNITESAFPYLWSNLMVIGAITLISKLGKATLVRNAVISSLHHSLLTDRKSFVLALS